VERLAADGLELHLQVVLCPGWNDGAVLEETVAEVAGLDSVADLGVVPVSLAHEGELRRVGGAEAAAVLEAVDGWQRTYRERRGRNFVHAADELYLLAGQEPPASDAPEQYENGVGISAALIAEATDVSAGEGAPYVADAGAPVPASVVSGVRLLTGVLARPVVERAAGILARPHLPVRAFVVENDLFGPHVTVTGLLGGAEVVEALRREPLGAGEWLVAPRTVVPGALNRTLDDVGEEELSDACDGRLVFAETLREGFATLCR